MGQSVIFPAGAAGLHQLVDELLKCRSVLLSTHVAPDPDAIGSCFALAEGLRRSGIAVQVYLCDALPERMRAFLPEGISWRGEAPEGETFDAVVVVDTASRVRIGGEVERVYACGPISFNIDHHASNIGWATYNYIDTRAAAAALIVSELLGVLERSAPKWSGPEVAADPLLANLLFAGLADDTGRFSFSNSDTRAFECAGSLLRAGAEPERVANALYFSTPERVLRLQAKVLAGLKLVLGGKVAMISIPRAMLQECGAGPEDAEGLVDLARSVEGAEAAFLQREIEDGWKISLRAKSTKIDMNAVAARFGGGGHKAAAGCRISGSEHEVTEQLVAALKEAM